MTDSELVAAKLDDLDRLCRGYYAAAVRVGVHQFVEYTGIMREHVGALRREAASGSSVCSLYDAPIYSGYEMRYIAEKLQCILGPRQAGILAMLLGDTDGR